MDIRIKDITGQRYGKLVAVRYSRSIKYSYPGGIHASRAIWICRCDCGKEVEVQNNSLQSGNTKSCGCTKHHGEDATIERLYTHVYKRRSEDIKYSRGAIPFELTLDQFKSLIFAKCVYCGSKPTREFISHRYQSKSSPIFVNTIDRIDSSKGYIQGNVVTACHSCNMMKRLMLPDEFINHCKKIVAYIG